MSEVADKLREARALIERGWIQRDYARDEKGNLAFTTDDTGVCFCAAGAIARVNKVGASSTVPGMMELSLAVGGDGDEADILIWNDTPGRTQAEVLAAFDKAIAIAEAEHA